MYTVKDFEEAMQKLGDDVYSVKMTKIKLKEIYGDIELFALHFDIYFFYKNLLITVLHHGNNNFIF